MSRAFYNVQEDHTIPMSTSARQPGEDDVRRASLTLADRADDRAELERWLDMLGLPPFQRPIRLGDRYLKRLRK